VSERITELIEGLYNQYGTLDPFALVEHAGIDLHYVPYLDNPMGQYLKLVGTPTILLSDTLEGSPERFFVLSHELHHALEHEDICSYYTLNSLSRSKMEQEANKFAAAMCLNLYIEEQEKFPETTVDLLNEYGVPLQLSEILL